MTNPFQTIDERLSNIESLLLDIKHSPKEATDQPRLLTRKQVCDLLSITQPTLWEWTRNGTICAYKVGTRVRYKESEVMQTLQRVQLTKIKRG